MTPPIEHLTEPQRACLRLVASHHNSKEIAGLLGVSPSAVDKRIERAVQMLDARSRFAAARMLVEHEGGTTSDRLPWEPIDVPNTADVAPIPLSNEPWWLARRLLGLSPGGRQGGRMRNHLTKLQRLGMMVALTLFVAVSSMVVLNMALTLSSLIAHYR
ncbi:MULTISPECIES: helix-turn-helix transcriptional regulator [unclassified Sphingomonas]|uniref:sigma factor-like helix-turn-helix DNA-binding protein n=1 Tax=unclassified Sphingomonas TaxID=196159 RepID=UPI001F5AFCF4|nr:MULTISPECIES: helix-turn-helix transcriptional regulator [unclassified Sphingomonas]